MSEYEQGQQEQEYMDLEGAKEASALGGSREPVPSGEYTARYDFKELGLSSGGYPQVSGQWVITEGEYAGRSVREWVVFSPKAAPFIKLRLRGLGLPLPGKMSTADIAVWYAKKANGRLATLTVGIGTNQNTGREYAEVVNLAPVSDQQRPATSSDIEDDVPF